MHVSVYGGALQNENPQLWSWGEVPFRCMGDYFCVVTHKFPIPWRCCYASDRYCALAKSLVMYIEKFCICANDKMSSRPCNSYVMVISVDKYQTADSAICWLSSMLLACWRRALGPSVWTSLVALHGRLRRGDVNIHAWTQRYDNTDTMMLIVQLCIGIYLPTRWC